MMQVGVVADGGKGGLHLMEVGVAANRRKEKGRGKRSSPIVTAPILAECISPFYSQCQNPLSGAGKVPKTMGQSL